MVVATDKVAVLPGGDPALAVHLNAARPAGDLAVHVAFSLGYELTLLQAHLGIHCY